MTENIATEDVLRQVLANQRALMERTQKILAQQEVVQKGQRQNARSEKVPLILKVCFT